MSTYGVLRGVSGRSHLANPKPLRQLLERETPVGDLTEVRLPLGVVTTRLDTGGAVLWREGRALEILTASCAVPGIVPPVHLGDGALHVDGGISSAAPVLLAQQYFPSDEIWLLDVLGTEDPTKHHRTLRDIYQASFAHAMQAQVNNEIRALRGPSLVHVKLDQTWTAIDSTDFSHTGDLIEAGHAAALRLLAGR